MIDSTQSAKVEETLSKYDIHDGWEDAYRNPENEKFYDMAFDLVAETVGRKGTEFLDVGCGSCSHSMRLVRRGYKVCAVDFSQPVVDTANKNIEAYNLHEQIRVQREDILNLTFEDETFDNVMCWGVLMHIPDNTRAISELDRVLKKGGMLVFSEVNVFSWHSMFLRFLRKFVGKKKKTVWSPAGYETWEDTDTGDLMTRQANIGWLQQQLRDRGYTIRRRAAGEFTEIYKEFSSPAIKNFFHIFNRFWFKRIGLAGPSLGNILVAEKK